MSRGGVIRVLNARAEGAVRLWLGEKHERKEMGASAGVDATASRDCRTRACVRQWKRLSDNGRTTPMEPLPTPVMSAFMEYLMKGNVVSRHGGNAGNLRP